MNQCIKELDYKYKIELNFLCSINYLELDLLKKNLDDFITGNRDSIYHIDVISPYLFVNFDNHFRRLKKENRLYHCICLDYTRESIFKMNFGKELDLKKQK